MCQDEHKAAVSKSGVDLSLVAIRGVRISAMPEVAIPRALQMAAAYQTQTTIGVFDSPLHRMLDRFERERAVLATRRVLETVQLSGS